MILSAVILAAGRSRRFPGNKMITEVTIDGVEAPLIKHTVSKFIMSGVFDAVAVVIGHEFQEVIKALTGLNVLFVYNNRYSEGMSSSVKAGVSAVARFSDAVAIHPGDVPYIQPSTLRTLAAEAISLTSSRGEFILIPRYGVKGGHPLIVSRGLLPKVLEISEECRGLKGFLRRWNHLVRYLPVDDFGVLADIDRLEDIERFSGGNVRR